MKLTRIFKTYFITFSILVHCAVVAIVVYFVSDQVTASWRWPIIKRWLLGNVDKSSVFLAMPGQYDDLPTGRWIKIHQQQETDSVRFARQAHAGSCFDPRRQEVIIFGSNTHGEDWNNAIYSFSMHSLNWRQFYPSDSPDTYTVNSKGIPVAGFEGNHPWAMHTFSAIECDLLRDTVVVASYPAHLSPDKYGKMLASDWGKIKYHPTWGYDLSINKWRAYEGNSIHFFPYAVAYNTDRMVITGFRPDGIYEWNGFSEGWNKIGQKGVYQYHINVVYDSVNQVFLLYGGNKMENTVYTYKYGDKMTRSMSTAGNRPPPGQSIPLVFHTKIAKLAALIDTEEKAETWLYDYKADAWQYIETADFPYPVKMNYTMEYDAVNNVIILISSPAQEQTAVWLLKL